MAPLSTTRCFFSLKKKNRKLFVDTSSQLCAAPAPSSDGPVSTSVQHPPAIPEVSLRWPDPYGSGSTKVYPKWNPGKWKHGLNPAVPRWFNFDPFPLYLPAKFSIDGRGRSTFSLKVSFVRQHQAMGRTFPKPVVYAICWTLSSLLWDWHVCCPTHWILPPKTCYEEQTYGRRNWDARLDIGKQACLKSERDSLSFPVKKGSGF